MATMTLSAATQQAIATALASGPGAQNQNYVDAYNDISADINAHGGFNPGTVNWFAQAAGVDQQGFVPSAQGTFIWNYTIGAAASEGVTVTDAVLGQATLQIASKVFQDIKTNGYVFTDSTSSSINFAPTSSPPARLWDGEATPWTSDEARMRRAPLAVGNTPATPSIKCRAAAIRQAPLKMPLRRAQVLQVEVGLQFLRAIR